YVGLELTPATKKLARAMLKCLHDFCNWIGQKINSQKSSVYFSKNTQRTKAISVNAVL
ncbi:hypothetical protein PanWU01x14_270100, partial [Parasponia andersonii]